jgi:hypothetical protein
MPRNIRQSLAVLASIGTIAALGISPAQANDEGTDLISGGKPPAGWSYPQQTYANIFAPMNANAPQGTIIADSGFRPYPNGFPMPNWGRPEVFNDLQLIYGIPTRVTSQEVSANTVTGPKPMNALSLRRTFGDGVCRDPKTIDPKTGNCELTFGAELLSKMIATSSRGGHCFGFAAAAAALYNGQLPANQVGASGLGVNSTNPMRQPATQTIARLFGTQYWNTNIQATYGGTSPTEVVNTLIRDLPGGTVPYVLVVLNNDAGHAITPFAVTDRGSGLYDIAVYDNNFPMRARAVTIDTKQDTFTYTWKLDPSAPGIEWNTEFGGRIGLVPIEEALKTQTCPVCVGEDQGTLLAFSSIKKANEDAVGHGLIDEQGNELSKDLYRQISPLNPPTDGVVSSPVIFVNAGVKFGVQVDTVELAAEQSMEIYAISNGEAQYVLLDKLASNSSTKFGVGGLDGTLFFSDAESSPRILQLSDQPGVSFDVNGHPLNLPANAQVTQRWNTKTERVVYESTANKALRWNIQIGGLDDRGGREYVGLKIRVPAGGQIVVDYTNANSQQPPKAWIRDKDGNREAITLQPVTKQLINDYRDEIYITQGPS